MAADAGTPLHDEGDNDSLFGSPPPTPGRGRSSSPLALPSGESSAQNVGTLALPGSHMFNELPSAPSPMMHDSSAGSLLQQQLQQCNWQPPSVPVVRQPPSDEACNVSSRGTSRSNTPAAASRPARAPRRTNKRTSHRFDSVSNVSTPRPTPPPITLPVSSEPPPSNFLRNQQALLGLAGLVGGVNPANLALPRGSSASNPIVLDDERDTPMIGRRPPQSYYAMAAAPVSYPTVVPVPSSEDIIQTLIKQKNIFPVVGALLSLVSRTSEGQSIWSQYQSSPAGFHRPYVNGPDFIPPSKRRKVSEVPAGAGDWDVPYPFPIGEGPSNYRTNWERQRSKQLIDDLIGLVKSAARKAAAKNYYRFPSLPAVMESEPGKVFRHYRPETLRYGLEPGQSPPMSPPPPPGQITAVPGLSRSSYVCPPAPSSSNSLSVPTTDSPTPSVPSIDDLLAAMMATPIEGQPSTTTIQNADAFPASPSVSSSSFIVSLIPPALSSSSNPASKSSTSQAPSNDIHPETQGNIDDFLAMLEHLPEGELSGLFTSSDDTFSSSSSTPAPPFSGTPTSESEYAGMQFRIHNPQTAREGGPSGIDLSDPLLASIDPVLLGFMPDARGFATDPSPPTICLNTDGEKRRSISAGPPPTPTLVDSPLSLAHDEHDPPTPTWDCVFPEPAVVTGSSGEAASELSTGVLSMQEMSVGEVRETEGNRYEGWAVDKRDKGKGRETEARYGIGSTDFIVCAGISMQDDRVGGEVGLSNPPNPYLSPASQAGMYANMDTTAYHAAISAPVQLPSQAQYAQPVASTSSTSASTSSMPSQPQLPFPLSIAIPILQATQKQQSATPTPSTLSQYKKHKHETVKRARAMREQLVAEIQRAKVELWETAMEGGCLAVLGKELAKEANGKDMSGRS